MKLFYLPSKIFYTLILISVVIITVVISCSAGNSVSIDSFEPNGVVDKLTTFTVRFSEQLAPPDKQNQWLSDELIEFDPKIEGKFKWLDGSTLIFSPDYPLDPIQSYKAEVTDKVLYNTQFSSDFDEYEFNTPDFDAYKVDFFWVRIPNQAYKISVQANIHFNYPVVPDQLKKYLEVKRDGEEVKNYQIISESSSDLIALNFGEIAQTDKEQELQITIKDGLESIYGKKPLEDTREFEQDLPPITKLAITGVRSGFDGTTGWIEVLTTQMVDDEKLQKYVSLDPGKNLVFAVDESYFRIESDMENQEEVQLKIKKGLPGLYGGELEFDFEQVVSLVNLEPSINFADKKGKYLMLGGNKNVQVNCVNIPEVEIEVSKVFKNNVLHFLNQYGYYSDYEYDYYYNPDYYVGDFGKPLYTEKKNLSESRNWLEKYNVNMAKALDDKYKGLYILSVRSSEDRWIQDSKIISISDLGLIVKKSGTGAMVFVNSINTTKPVNDVEISIISSNNQIIAAGKTNEDGWVKFENLQDKFSEFTPRVVTAELGDDFNFVDLRETFIETSRFDVGGIYEYSEQYSAFLYGDRNLYRPGEKINITGIVRNEKIKLPEEMPVIIKIITPTGKIYDEYKKNLNKQGSFEISFDMPDYAQTGEYTAELYTGAYKIIGSYKFSIEDFVPDKIRVTLKSSKEKFSQGENVNVNIDAEFLFGAKASGLKWESDVQLRHRPFDSKSFPKYDFATSSVTASEVPGVQSDGTLDENGKAVLNYTIPQDLYGSGLFSGFAYVSVFDLTGRTVNRFASFDVYPNKEFVGIYSPGYYFSTKDKINFKIVAVDDNDKSIGNYPVNVELVRYEWQTILKKDYSDRYYYASEKKEIIEWRKQFNIKGETKIPVTASSSGEYRLRVYKKDSDDYNYTSFYAYGWGGSTASTFEVDKEGRVDIVLDKEKYSPGEKAKVLFTTPFAGRMLVTIERNGVYDHQYIDVKERSAEIELPIKEDYLPNVYVSATLFKKHTPDSNTPFFVGHGYASLKVEKKENKLPVTIKAPEKVKPNTTQEITIQTKSEGDIYVTVAAVDEGILQIKDFRTPDPYGYMYAKRSLKVDSYDLYELLLPEIISKSAPGGGDLASQLKKRTNPVTSKRFKLLAFWSGIKTTNSDGTVKIKLNIPQFNGEVRLMAVAYSNSSFGSGEKMMKVADDIIIEPEVPRFLAPNDSLVMPVTIVNTTSSSGNLNVKVSLKGPLKLLTEQTKSVSVAGNSTAQAKFVIKADSKIGEGKIIIETTGKASVKETIDIGIRPVSPLVTQTGTGNVTAGNEVKLDIPGNFMQGTQSTTLTISKFPALKFAKQLKYLVGYPHGCIEQTVSKLFPQLYFEELAKLIAPELYRTNNPVYYVKEGIRKIESMQLYDGSLAYWQGDSYSSWWGSVYGAHFLLEAKKVGFKISESMLNKLLKYIGDKAKEKSTYDYVVYSGNQRSVRKIANKEIIYTLYVLALSGKGDFSTMNYYKSKPHLLSEDMKYVLGGAYALMGKWNAYKEIIPSVFKTEKTETLTGGCFDSEIRSNAIMLNVLLEVDKTNKQISYMIKHISDNANNMYSTQERSWAFLALGKAAKLNAEADVKIDIIANGKTIKKFDGKDLTITDAALNNGQIKLKSSGKGEVYYFWSTEGIKVNEKVKEEDSFMQVRKTFYDYRTKSEIANNNFKQGQLIVCKISLTGFERSAENIVITDLIPSGFEIENPRLAASTDLNWTTQTPITVQYLDIRDDRLLIFTDLPRNTSRQYYYMLRVVNQGNFELPVIGAEAMYDREFHSYNGAGKITVVAR
ncbi:MAG: MG2 domain-containing protein [bacterium]